MCANPSSIPLVSVITPTYNRAALLPETIRSVLAQDYPRIEYLVLDDGSTDETPAVLSRYAGRIACHQHPNLGEARTVNKGWELARGDLILTVSSDDPIRPGLIAAGVEFLRARPEVLVAYPDWAKIDEQSRVIGQVLPGEYDYRNMLRWHHCFPGPGSIMRRRCLEVAGFRDPKYRFVADFEYWLRVGRYGPMARIPQALATWRVHAGSATQACGNAAMAAEHLRMIEDYFAQPDLPLEIQQVQDEALGAANFIAGELCCQADFHAARQYYRRSLRIAAAGVVVRPGGKPFPWRRRLAMCLPEPVYRTAQACWRRLRVTKQEPAVPGETKRRAA